MAEQEVSTSMPRTAGTYLQAVDLVRRHRIVNWPQIALLLFVLALLGTALIAFLNDFPVFSARALLVLVSVPTLGTLGGWVGGWIQWRWIRRRSLREWLSYEGPISYVLTPEFVRMRFSGGESELRWDLFRKAVLTDSFLLLYCAPQLAWFVPTNQLDPATIDQVARWASDMVPGGLKLSSASTPGSGIASA